MFEIEVTIPVSETQAEIVLEHMMYDFELYTIKSEFAFIVNAIKGILNRDGNYNFVGVVGAELDLKDVVWKCKVKVTKNEKTENQNQHIHNSAPQSEEC